jgi:hypothetical protein
LRSLPAPFAFPHLLLIMDAWFSTTVLGTVLASWYPSLFTPEPPGFGLTEDMLDALSYCYLILFVSGKENTVRNLLGRLPRRAALENLADLHPDWLSADHFTLAFSRPPGLQKGHVVAHVSLSNQHKSALTAKEVIDLLPPNSHVGAETLTTANPTQVVHSPLSQPTFNNPCIRRFLLDLTTLKYTTTPTHGTYDVLQGHAKQWTRNFPHVTIRSLNVRFVPMAGAASAEVVLHTAWHWAAVDDLSGTKIDKVYADSLNSYDVHAIGAGSDGAVAKTLVVPAIFDAELSRQLKPAPRIGGYPRFYMNWTMSSVNGTVSLDTYSPAKKEADGTTTAEVKATWVYRAYVEVVLDATPGQPLD